MIFGYHQVNKNNNIEEIIIITATIIILIIIIYVQIERNVYSIHKIYIQISFSLSHTVSLCSYKALGSDNDWVGECVVSRHLITAVCNQLQWDVCPCQPLMRLTHTLRVTAVQHTFITGPPGANTRTSWANTLLFTYAWDNNQFTQFGKLHKINLLYRSCSIDLLDPFTRLLWCI